MTFGFPWRKLGSTEFIDGDKTMRPLISPAMNLKRRDMLLLAAATAAPTSLLAAPEYPDKPIRIVVPFVAGGGGDIVSRYMAQALSGPLGQPVIVENYGGAGGLVGVNIGLAAPPNGSTLIFISSSYTVNPSLYKLKYDPVRDITPLAQMTAGPLLVVVNPKLPVKSMADLAALARSKPGQVTYASSGQGSALHLAAVQFARQARVEMLHVPYKGGGAALIDVLNGTVDVYFAATGSAIPHVQSGKLRAIAVTTNTRLSLLPDVPTIAESGYPGYDVTLWYGLIGPKGMPPAVVSRINAEVNKVLSLPATAEKFQAEGVVPAAETPAIFGRRIEREIAQWRETVGALGIKPE
jgi:tripartite-type tricarboxylate transporter receptor subunit TctC